jgi:uncharacterized protein
MEAVYCVFNKTAESFLGLNIRCPSTVWARLKGSLGKLRFGSDQGLWLVPSRGIHTAAPFFPIDIVYLDAQNRVIYLVEHARPIRLMPIRWRSRSILMLPPHTIYATNTKLGDQLLICSPQETETYLNKLATPAGTKSAP